MFVSFLQIHFTMTCCLSACSRIRVAAPSLLVPAATTNEALKARIKYAATATAIIGKRPFFASSTDHTRLLKEAAIHRFHENAQNRVTYILAASGADKKTVESVPHIHLARLFVKDQTLYGAKVINRTLGKPIDVCGRLVDAALDDAGPGAGAQSTLHGLSEWVLRGLDNKESIDVLQTFSDAERSIIKEIANGQLRHDRDRYETQGQTAWERLIVEFLQKGLGDEAALYQSKGAKFLLVEHFADTSDYGDLSGYAMARLAF